MALTGLLLVLAGVWFHVGLLVLIGVVLALLDLGRRL